MATANELLASLSNSVPKHDHVVTDRDTYYVIDPETRQITNAASATNVLMEFDHDSERFTFELPRYVEGHDMMLCNRVRVHFNNYSEETGIDYADVYEVDDLKVDPNNKDNVICTWLVSRHATRQAGMLSFLVQYACIDSNNNEVYEWHSDIYTDVVVKPGKDNGEGSVIEYTNILEQWRADLFGAGDSVISDIQDASDVQQAEIEAKGAETIASIPEDYTTVANMADKAIRTKAEGITPTESGKIIYLDDATDCNVVGLNLYGKTTQTHTKGYQLFDYSGLTTMSAGGATITNNGDGTFTISGGGQLSAPFSQYHWYTHEQTVNLCRPGILRFSDSPSLLPRVYIHPQQNGNNLASMTTVEGNNAFEITQEMLDDETFRLVIGYYAPQGHTIVAGVSRPMLYQAGEGVWEPYTLGHASPSASYPQECKSIVNPTVELYGKNLLLDANISRRSTVSGITSEYEGDGIFHIYGTYNTAAESIQLNTSDLYIPIDSTRTYSMYVKVLEGSIPNTYHPYVGVGSDKVPIRNWFSVYVGETATVGQTLVSTSIPGHVLSGANRLARFWIYHYNPGAIQYTIDFRIQVWITEGTDSEYTPSDEKQVMSISRTLKGIPVSQNGNYTDSDGQQWICDEIEFERGKFIQRIGTLEINADTWVTAETFSDGLPRYAIEEARDLVRTDVKHYYCNVLPYGYGLSTDHISNTPSTNLSRMWFRLSTDTLLNTTAEGFKNWAMSNEVKVLYVMATPIETDLTAVELQAFRQLHTNATDTSVCNKQDVTMSIKYIADLKEYIWKNITYKRQKFNLNLVEANWVESSDGRYYSQVLNVDARPNSEISLQPTAEQQLSLILDGLAMFVANDNGVVTVYSIAGTPGRDITIPATETVVVYE